MNTLTDRYLAATLRTVPTPRREEIASELRASIEDMIEDRAGSGQDATVAEREVLTELGNPDLLAARYADRRLQLIGPTYYLVWLRLLKLLLSLVPAIVGTVVSVSAQNLSYLLAVYAGFFLYVGSSDLLPAAHARTSPLRIALTLAGFAATYAIVAVASR